MHPPKYRPEIDGLRALAVLGVILFHYDLGIHGGYVGVDVFFVISGYLITQIIVKETHENRFSLKNFWMRRIRRIIPMASILVLTCLAAGAIILPPSSLVQLAKSAFAYAIMMSNVYFWRTEDYFTESLIPSPLLHTWSLSVEEQFYLFYPILLFLLLRFCRKSSFWIILLLCSVSFGLSAYSVFNYQAPTFYLLPTRAWELMAGGLLAIPMATYKSPTWAKECLSLSGIGLILFSMLCYDKATIFPGLLALPPVIGSTAFIFANQGKLTRSGSLLASAPMVAIGLISYSLYLWHWPILIYSKHIITQTTPLIVCIQFAAIGLLSYFTWRFVEQPFRKSRRLTRPAFAFPFAAIITTSIVGLSVIVIIADGFPSRLSPEMISISNDIQSNGASFSSKLPSGIPMGAPSKGVTPDFVVWGDSHAMAAGQMLDDAAKSANLSGRAIMTEGAPPVPNLWKTSFSQRRRDMVLDLNRKRLQWIINNKVRNVILIARWDVMLEGRLATEFSNGSKETKLDTLVIDSPEMDLTPENSQAALYHHLSDMIQLLHDHDIRVWILMQGSVASRARVANDFYLSKRFPSLNPPFTQWDTPRDTYEKMRARSKSVFSKLKFDNLTIIDPISAFYGTNERLKIYEDHAFFSDEDHLTEAGANFYLKSFFDKIFSEISQQKKKSEFQNAVNNSEKNTILPSR